jgi:hypothetical protein
VRAVVEPEADDLVGVENRRQQLDLGEWRAGVRVQPGVEALEVCGGEQLAHGGPRIDDAVVAEYAGPGRTLRAVADDAHAGTIIGCGPRPVRRLRPGA